MVRVKENILLEIMMQIFRNPKIKLWFYEITQQHMVGSFCWEIRSLTYVRMIVLGVSSFLPYNSEKNSNTSG